MGLQRYQCDSCRRPRGAYGELTYHKEEKIIVMPLSGLWSLPLGNCYGVLATSPAIITTGLYSGLYGDHTYH